MSGPVPPREVEFWRDAYVNGNRVRSEVIAMGIEAAGGNVVVPRVFQGTTAVTLWLNVLDAAEELGADHINHRCPMLVTRARRSLAGGRKEQAR